MTNKKYWKREYSKQSTFYRIWIYYYLFIEINEKRETGRIGFLHKMEANESMFFKSTGIVLTIIKNFVNLPPIQDGLKSITSIKLFVI